MLLNKEILIGIYGSQLRSAYSIIPDIALAIEGWVVNFTVNALKVSDGTILYWTTLQVDGNIDSSDFVENSLNGSVTIDSSNTGTITRTLAENSIVEGNESFKLELRTDSISGPIVAVSNTVVILKPFKLEIDTTLI